MKRTILVAAFILAIAIVWAPTAQQPFQPPMTPTSGATYINGLGAALGPVLLPDGLVGAASLSFVSEPTTGIWRSAAGRIDFSNAGVNTYRFENGFLTIFSNTAQIRLGAAQDLIISRVAAGEFGLSTVLFAALGTPANGTFCYCSDCTIANPCAGGGTGALAKRLNGVWVCN